MDKEHYGNEKADQLVKLAARDKIIYVLQWSTKKWNTSKLENLATKNVEKNGNTKNEANKI